MRRPGSFYRCRHHYIGEAEFNSQGIVCAQGADWDHLLDGKRQSRLPYNRGARGERIIWMWRKISEPWEDGAVPLKFLIDTTDENTIVFQNGNNPEKIFWNLLAFSNQEYPDFAFCCHDVSGSNSSKETLGSPIPAMGVFPGFPYC